MGAAQVGGRASVGPPPIGGRASVSPGGGGPGGPGGPPGGGSGGSGGSGGRKPRNKADKKHRRANILTAAAAVLVIMLGVGIVGGTYFFDDIKLPQAEPEAQMNKILTSTNKVLEQTGSPRINVPPDQISKVMQDAVAAAEDNNFWDHEGIDFKGIMRAAWNNFTGGELQGASTITQQYARHVADEKDISYSRKLREAVIARKLESEYNKTQIMGMYLNYIDLGRGRYGAESAANGYFGTSVINGAKKPITIEQAAVLASIIKQPYATSTHQGYDPANNPTGALERWEYTMGKMYEMGAITKEQYDARKYPKALAPAKSSTNNVDGKPIGMVMRHVTYELHQLGITEEMLTKGGYTVTTTIVPKVQAAAEKAGSRLSKTSPLYNRSKKMQAAVIGIDPKTGEVLGMYGGDNPTGTDYAGYMSGNGEGVLDNAGQSPGSTFKIYTLAAGLKEDISFDTVWDGTKERNGGGKISNAGASDANTCNGKISFCDLRTGTIKSYNFPFYWIADTIGQDKVIEAARDAGVQTMWTDDAKKIDLNDATAAKMKSSFDNEVAFGQYRVVPLEHAAGVATIVNQGVKHDAHFIKSISQRDSKTGANKVIYTASQKGKRVFPEDQMAGLADVLKEIAKKKPLANGRPSIGKSGTWEIKVDGKSLSGDTWFVGGIPQLAATVWVGGSQGRIALKETNDENMFGSGTPMSIWKEFLDTSAEAMKWDNESFPPGVKTGQDDKGNGVKPVEVELPAQDNSQYCTALPDEPICQTTGNDDDDDDTDTDGNNGGGNGGGPGNR
ncbi:transglycosylase domain-containing protein [Actinoplanes derwentensis]|uniref:Membrane carboxypeptidase (Penicillin-binding protein) n=1 Tax=Actinoplanes derwentensis TaxID=113562 RepID=A0A1H2CU44_9ACTN|nr:transglycosylase domain-containing protein [Actinoplanes derwentensis]SDT73777.1 Membrane carboxypeptidase (penicillin-binding protein) [Actinoplanes derwentensis]